LLVPLKNKFRIGPFSFLLGTYRLLLVLSNQQYVKTQKKKEREKKTGGRNARITVLLDEDTIIISSISVWGLTPFI